MRTVLSLGIGFALALSAAADVVVEQEFASPMANGKMVMKVRPGVARIDQPSPTGGSVTTIINTDADEMVTLMHQQKMAMRLPLTSSRQKAEGKMKEMGLDPKAMKPVATGQKEKVGVWDTEIYTASGGGMEMRLWVAKDFPEAAKYKEAMAKFSKAASGGSMDPNSFDVPGMVVKSEGKMPMAPGQTMTLTTTLTSVREVTVPDSEYTVPEGYQAMELPPGLGGQ